MSDWQRMGFGRCGISHAVSEAIAQAMNANLPATSAIRIESRPPLEGPEESPLRTATTREPLQRDARGRMLAAPPIVEQADEKLSADEVKTRLTRLMKQSPQGSLGALAQACGFRSYPRQTMRRVASGKGTLMEASRRRISRVLNQIERGELVCVPTAKRVGQYTVYAWEQRVRPAAAPRSINSRQV